MMRRLSVRKVIAGAAAAGVSLERLRKLVGLPLEALADLLKSLVATGQVTVLKVNGQMTYRAA